jgi:hypothetical protein
MQKQRTFVTVNARGADAQFCRGSIDARGNFAAIGREQFGKGGWCRSLGQNVGHIGHGFIRSVERVEL